MEKDENRIEFPLTLFPNEDEAEQLKVALTAFMEYFKCKNPYLTVIKIILWSYKVLQAKQNGKGYYYGIDRNE